MKISVVMPVYSEEESVRKVVHDVIAKIRPHIFEILIVVSPDSTQRTFDICRELEREEPFVHMMIQKINPGYGRAYREAFAVVGGDYVLMLDADGQFELTFLPQMIRAAESGADVVQGARWIPGGEVKGVPLHINIANRAFQYFLRALFRARLHDLTRGYKLISTKVIRTVPWEGVRHELAMETLLKPFRYGYRVVEVPTPYRARKEGRSKNQNLAQRLRRYFPLAIRIYFNRPPPGSPAYENRHRNEKADSDFREDPDRLTPHRPNDILRH